MVGFHPREILRSTLHSAVFRYTIFLLTLAMAGTAIIAAILGIFSISSQLASLSAALATILLVSLTAQYAEQTQKLVDENRKTRKQRREERELDRARELESLRRALYEEIRTIQYYEDLVEVYEPSHSAVEILGPSTIYESNADQIGLLTGREIDSIVEYYTRLDHINALLEVQKERDTVVGKGYLDEMFRRFEGIFDKQLSFVTFGYWSSSTERRTEGVRMQFEGLVEAQERALDALEENFEHDSTD